MRKVLVIVGLLVLLSTVVSAKPIQIQVDEIYHHTWGYWFPHIIDLQKERILQNATWEAHLYHSHHHHCPSNSFSVRLNNSGQTVYSSPNWNPGTCGVFTGSFDFGNIIADKLIWNQWFGTKTYGFEFLDFFMEPGIIQDDLTVEDGAVKIGNIDDLLDPSPASNRFVLTNPDLDVLVWAGNDDDFIRQSTTDSNDDIWACLDTNFNGVCDDIDAQPCLNAGGDWYRGSCCGIDVPALPKECTTLSTTYFLGSPITVQGCQEITESPGGDSCDFNQINILKTTETCTAGQFAFQPTTCVVDSLDFNETFDAWCGQNEQGEWEWAAADDTGNTHRLLTCPGANMVGYGTGLYQCGGAPQVGTDPFPVSRFVEIDQFGITHEYHCEIGGGQTGIVWTEFINHPDDIDNPSCTSESGIISCETCYTDGTYCANSGDDDTVCDIDLTDTTTSETMLEFNLDILPLRGNMTIIGGEKVTCDLNGNTLGFSISVVDRCGEVIEHEIPASAFVTGPNTLTCTTEGIGNNKYKGFKLSYFAVEHDLAVGSAVNSTITECNGTGAWSQYFNQTGEIIVQAPLASLIPSLTPLSDVNYCASDNDYTTDLDIKDDISCFAAGFTWTGSRCCSEADDPEETYDDLGGIGACWNKSFVQNGFFEEDDTILTVNGTLQGCDFGSAGVPCTQTPSDAVAWWPAEGTNDDIVGGNDLTINTGTFGPGRVGQAFVFDGKNFIGTYAQAVDDPSLDFGQDQDFTIEVWIKPAQITTLNDGHIIAFKSDTYSASTPGFIFQFVERGDLVLSLHDGGFFPTLVQASSVISTTDWHHVAAVRESDTVLIYVDGVKVDEGITTSASLENDAPLNIGAGVVGVPNSNPSYFNGSIDELTIYKRTLSENEILAIFNAGSDGKCDVLPSLPHFNPVCTVVPEGTPSGQAFCSNSGDWEVDNADTNRTILKDIAWTDPGVPQSECCSSTSCWTGTFCQDDQSDDAGGPTYDEIYRCEDGAWIEKPARFTWDRGSQGYCPTASQCLVDNSDSDAAAANNNDPDSYFDPTEVDPNCIADTQYIADHLCENGIWSTRTKQLGLQLLNYSNGISPAEYSLFCGPAADALNDVSDLSGLISDTSCGTGKHTDERPCINNFCVLNTPQGVAWGASVNVPINDPSDSVLLAIGEDVALCDGVDQTSLEYEQCGTSNYWYNPATQSLIFIPIGSLDPADIPTLFINLIQDPFDLLRNFVFSRLHDPGQNDYSFFNNTHTYDQMYAAKKDNSFLFAFLEEDIRREIPQGYHDYLGVLYTDLDLGPDPCFDLILKYDSQASCNSTSTEIDIIAQIGTVTRPSPITQAWKDLTAKLRPGG